MVSVTGLAERFSQIGLVDRSLRTASLQSLPHNLLLLLFDKLSHRDQLALAGTSRRFFKLYQLKRRTKAEKYLARLIDLRSQFGSIMLDPETLQGLLQQSSAIKSYREIDCFYRSQLFRLILGRYFLMKQQGDSIGVPSWAIQLASALFLDESEAPQTLQQLSSSCYMKEWNTLIHRQGSFCCYFSLFLKTVYGREFLMNALPHLREQHRGKLILALTKHVSREDEFQFLINQLFRGVLDGSETYLAITSLCLSKSISSRLVYETAQRVIYAERAPSRNNQYHHFLFRLAGTSYQEKKIYHLLYEAAHELLPFHHVHLLVSIACQDKAPLALKWKIFQGASRWTTPSQNYLYNEVVTQSNFRVVNLLAIAMLKKPFLAA